MPPNASVQPDTNRKSDGEEAACSAIRQYFNGYVRDMLFTGEPT